MCVCVCVCVRVRIGYHYNHYILHVQESPSEVHMQ